jgi:hypothetical protein
MSPVDTEKAATRSPAGEAAGEISEPRRLSGLRNGRPNSPGSPVSSSVGRYFLRSHSRNSSSNSSGSIRKVRSTAGPTPAPRVFRYS